MSVDNQNKTSPEWSSYPDPVSAAADRSVNDHDPQEHPQHPPTHGGHGGHGWMMVLMCLPLVAIGVWQFANGGGWVALLGGLGCFAMMAVMHLGMSSTRH